MAFSLSTMPGPLATITVVEFAGIGPAPYCGMLLADLGAAVIRIDRPDTVADTVPLFGRGKQSVAIDLKHPDGVEAALRVVQQADALIEGYRPGVMERLGLGPEVVHARQPSLVYGRMTGWGQSGPRSQTAGHDIDYLAVAGALGAIGIDTPVPPLNLVADFGGGGMFLAVGVLAGVLESKNTGRGQVIDAAMVDGVAHLTTMFHSAMAAGWWTPQRHSNLLDGAAPFYTTYRCADGGYVAVGALEPEFFAALLEGLGIDETLDQMDRSGWPEMRARFGRIFETRSRSEWDDHFAGSDACVAPVYSLAEAPADPHLAARETFVELGGVLQPAPAPRLGAGPVARPDPSQPIGRSTREVMIRAGYEAAEISRLERSGTVRSDLGGTTDD